MSKQASTQQSGVTPTGLNDDGIPYFKKGDITVGGTCKLNNLPIGSVPLVLCASDLETKERTYSKGKDVPIFVKLDDAGKRYYICKHVIQEADEKKRRKKRVCNMKFIAGHYFNIESLQSHVRNHMDSWTKKVLATTSKNGGGLLTGFFSKKQKTDEDSTTAAAPSVEEVANDVADERGTTNNMAGFGSIDSTCAAADERTSTLDDDLRNNTKEDTSSVAVVAPILQTINDTNKAGIHDTAVAQEEQVDGAIAMETFSCDGIKYTDVHNIKYDVGYEFGLMYPYNIHVDSIKQKYNDSNLIPKVDWSADTLGNLRSNRCNTLFYRNPSKLNDVKATTTKSSNTACVECVRLQYNQQLFKVMHTSASNAYNKKTPNILCPTSVVNTRYLDGRNERQELRHTLLNANRKTISLTRSNDDYKRLMLAISNDDVPNIKRILTTHIRNGGSVASFVLKLTKAASYKLVGHGTHAHTYVQRGRRQRDGKPFDDEAYKILLMTVLMWKLGSRNLVQTFKFTCGGLSYRQARRHVNENGTIPSFKPGITTSINDHGKAIIKKNMNDVFLDPKFVAILPQKKCLVHILVDGVAIEERLNIDESVLPHQVTGLCRHCPDATFNTYGDATRIEAGLGDNFHLAKEAEVVVLTFNSGEFTSVVVLCISPTCKKDDIIGESTDTIKEILSTILECWYSYPQHFLERFVLSTISSDGAPAFRKGVGKVLNKDLSAAVRSVYVTNDFTKRCQLLNLTASAEDVTGSVDSDHLLKRLRARVKTAKGITIVTCNFTKVDLAHILAITKVVDSEDEADRLFNPEDLMDVCETVNCMYAIGRLGTIEWHDYPAEWRNEYENQHKYKELRLLGNVAKLACTAVVGHEDNIAEEGNHLSISEYLVVLSTLAHLLFFLYRKNRTDFIPAQNYRNWQETVKNMYISVTKAKVSDVEDFYWFLNSSKKIEEFFGIMRSFAGGNLNFDCLELRNRAGDAATCNWIYGQYPEWKEPSRRLTSSIDRKNVRSWKGDTKLANVNEIACWNSGRDQALEILRSSNLFSAEELNINHILETEPGVDMFRPYCRTIGVLAGDRAEYDLVDLEDEADDEEVET
eukprot:scaffold19230_cov154-Skeletonema_menzelii.AAC.1